MSNQVHVAASGPIYSSIHTFVRGPGHQQFYEAASTQKQPPVQAAAARLDLQLVSCAGIGSTTSLGSFTEAGNAISSCDCV